MSEGEELQRCGAITQRALDDNLEGVAAVAVCLTAAAQGQREHLHVRVQRVPALGAFRQTGPRRKAPRIGQHRHGCCEVLEGEVILRLYAKVAWRYLEFLRVCFIDLLDVPPRHHGELLRRQRPRVQQHCVGQVLRCVAHTERRAYAQRLARTESLLHPLQLLIEGRKSPDLQVRPGGDDAAPRGIAARLHEACCLRSSGERIALLNDLVPALEAHQLQVVRGDLFEHRVRHRRRVSQTVLLDANLVHKL
mmetsp:Transcript_23693/g.70512  ORF Transcript_23693/g.70512 Transcript_23693/m.70512 type:complete len:250 (-) Transcript_23693:319-1068(-)